MKIEKGDVVAITGASRGIGKAAALEFAKKGARVVLLARDQKRLEEVAEEIKKGGGESFLIRCDVSKEPECFTWVEKVIQKYGRIDVLINNAGFGHYSSIENLKTEELKTIFNTNLYGSFWCAKAVIPHMKKNQRGHIVNVSTIISKRSLPFMTAYCMTKFAMNAFDEGLRLELRPFGIGVSLVCPGLTDTEFQTNAGRSDYQPNMRSNAGMTAEKVGKAILKAVTCNRRRVELTMGGKMLLLAQRVWPSFVDEVLYRAVVKRALHSSP